MFLGEREEFFRQFLKGFGIQTEEEHLKGTPQRVVQMYEELFKGYQEPDFKFTTFDAGETPSLVTVADIDYYSLCSHHLMPFFGKAHVAYLPDKKLCGLSKLPRAIKHFCAKLQVQERLTGEIADFLVKKLEPKALAVVLQGRHLCMEIRGVKTPCAITTTSAMRGLFLDKEEGPGLKDEFFKIIELSKR